MIHVTGNENFEVHFLYKMLHKWQQTENYLYLCRINISIIHILKIFSCRITFTSE